jgi:exopolysaccharide biosynthesis polyprenyl glycosylphosphotransferase
MTFKILKPKILVVQLVVLVSDILFLSLSEYFSTWFRFQYLDSTTEESDLLMTVFGIEITTTFIGVLVVLFWVLTMTIYGAYKFNIINGGSTLHKITLNSGILTLAVLAFFSYYLRLQYSRLLFAITIPIGVVVLTLWHFLVRRLIRLARKRTRFFEKKGLLIGSPKTISKFRDVLQKSSEIGIYAWDSIEKQDVDLDQIKDIAEQSDIVMVLGSAAGDSDFVRKLRWKIEGTGTELVLDSNLTTIAGRRLHISALHNLPLIHISIRQNVGWRFVIKRFVDIVFSTIILIILSIPFLIIALIIKLDSPGPVFFRQERVGRNHKLFKIFKFRTMKNNAEASLDEVLEAEGKKVETLYKIKNDPRITKVGGFFRKTSIDELPQFINSLMGSMSIVGPRPQILREIESNSSVYNRRLVIKPGITGPWQVGGRSSLTLSQATELDLDYIENWTLLGDAKIICQTIREVIAPKGAY